MKNLTLATDREPSIWEEAYPIGNGSLGGMVFGNVLKDKLLLNLDTLWSGCGDRKDNTTYKGDRHKLIDTVYKCSQNTDHGKAEELSKEYLLGDWSECYLPAGELSIDLSVDSKKYDVKNYSLALDLNSAVCENRFTLNGITFTRDVFALCDYENKSICYSMETIGGESFDISLSLNSKLRFRVKADENSGTITLKGKAPSYAAPNYYDCENPIRYDGESLDFALKVLVEKTDGNISVSEGTFRLEGISAFRLYITGETNLNISVDNRPLPHIDINKNFMSVIDKRLDSDSVKFLWTFLLQLTP